MRTTVRLQDELLIEAKKYAAEQRLTLTALIEEALRDRLAKKPKSTKPRLPLPVFRGGQGLQPGADLDDHAALMDLMEGTSNE